MFKIKKNNRLLQLLGAIALCVLAGVSQAEVVREARALSAETLVVEVRGPIELRVSQGTVPAMSVSADRSRLPRITTEQDGNTLRIVAEDKWYREVKSFFWRPKSQGIITVELTLPAIRELFLRGSGDTQLTGFSGDRIKLASEGSGNVVVSAQYKQVDAVLQGSGNFELKGGINEVVNLSSRGSGNFIASGQGKLLTAHMAGSGNLDTDRFLIDKADISMAGSGNSAFFARDTVLVRLKGSGNVTVFGNPVHRDVQTKGSGEVHWK